LALDALPVVGLAVLALILMWATRNRMCDGDTSALDLGAQCGSGVSPLGVIGFVAAWLAMVGYGVWNFGLRQGRTGSSIGKGIMKFKVVSEKTWQPIGFGLSIVRQLAHFVDAIICYIGYLFPLWDPKRQTLADKIMTTVCVPIS
jgi:uncharacterized RDD family membrane protein YckC